MPVPTVLVTAGPTREYMDPVRFISNPSSGKMGYALARAARRAGARVVLVSGPVDLRPPRGVRLVRVESAREMYRAVMAEFRRADILVMAAAVSDYRPARRLRRKMKKGRRRMTLALVRTDDILAAAAARKGKKIVAGFAAETGDPLREARRKLEEKGLDLIVGNDVSSPGAGFGSDLSRAVVVIGRGGGVERFAKMKKDALARLVIRRCIDLSSGE